MRKVGNRIKYRVGDEVQVQEWVIRKKQFPAEFRRGVVVEVNATDFGNGIIVQNIKVHHPNGVWGWIGSEIEPLHSPLKEECECIQKQN